MPTKQFQVRQLQLVLTLLSSSKAFLFSGKVQVPVSFFAFFDCHSVIHWDGKVPYLVSSLFFLFLSLRVFIPVLVGSLSLESERLQVLGSTSLFRGFFLAKGSYSPAYIQSVYTTAPTDWALPPMRGM